jgi:hypothetical protein
MDYNEIKRRLSNYFAPLQASVRSANKRAEALIRANLRSAAQPPNVHNKRASTRIIGAGGVNSYANRYKDPDSVIKIGGVEMSRTKGTTEHDLSFGRNTPDYEDSLSPRKNISPANAKIRQANIKFQNGILLSEVKEGDRVTATPIASESGRNPRAAIYSRMTNGALKSGVTEDGLTAVESRRLPNNQWRNILGEKKTFDPKELTKDLAKLAARRLVVQHPAAQVYLQADNAVKVATGEGITERIGRGHRTTTEDSIKKRLKGGERFFLPQALPY